MGWYDFVRYGLLNYTVPHFSWMYFVGYMIPKLFFIIVPFLIYLYLFKYSFYKLNWCWLWIFSGLIWVKLHEAFKMWICKNFISQLFCVVRSLKEVRENTYFSQGSQGKVREFHTGSWLATLRNNVMWEIIDVK